MIRVMRYAIFISFVLICALGFSKYTSAQAISVQTSVNIELVPQIPKAGDLVTVYLSSYSTNINTATITWRVDGKTIKSGVGEKTFSFNMGNEGVKTNLSVTIRTQAGESITKTIPLRATSVDLIWQTDGVVPPFYKGKAMFSHQNNVTVIAMPHLVNSSGVEISSKNLVYTWKKNGSVMESVSGFGKSTYTFEGSIISRNIDVSVEVTSSNSASMGFATLKLQPKEPDIIFYKKDPTYGIELNKALNGNVLLNGSSEVTVIGIPFSFNSKDETSGSLNYKWSINGVVTGEDNNQDVQTFRQKEGSSGTAKISLSIENPNRVLQYASRNFNLTFGNRVNQQ